MIRVVALALVISCSIVGAYPQGPDAGEQRSIDQLRAIAETIKSCQPPGLSPEVVDPGASEGFESVYGPPVSVVWNVELHPSIRSRYIGSIEFSEPSFYRMPATDSYCNKPRINKSECRHRYILGMRMLRNEESHPFQFRYEFDVTELGIEFLKASKKIRQIDDEQWVAGDIYSDVCASTAIRLVLSKPTSEVPPSPPMSARSEIPKPSGIPETLWVAASAGDSDAQFYLGNLYAQGKGVPQDYVESYFWLSIAASGKSETVPQEEMAKARDACASRLTPSVLLQTQEKAKKWFEGHSH